VENPLTGNADISACTQDGNAVPIAKSVFGVTQNDWTRLELDDITQLAHKIATKF